jgi:hypothetical protein
MEKNTFNIYIYIYISCDTTFFDKKNIKKTVFSLSLQKYFLGNFFYLKILLMVIPNLSHYIVSKNLFKYTKNIVLLHTKKLLLKR